MPESVHRACAGAGAGATDGRANSTRALFKTKRVRSAPQVFPACGSGRTSVVKGVGPCRAHSGACSDGVITPWVAKPGGAQHAPERFAFTHRRVHGRRRRAEGQAQVGQGRPRALPAHVFLRQLVCHCADVLRHVLGNPRVPQYLGDFRSLSWIRLQNRHEQRLALVRHIVRG